MFEPLLSISEVGRVLKARRLELNLPQDDVAHAAGMSRITLSRLESGVSTDLKLGTVLRLLRHYGLKLMLAPGTRAPTLTELDLRRDLERHERLQLSAGATESAPAPDPTHPASGTRMRARRSRQRPTGSGKPR